ncbi:uracil-DNA glycosylase [Meiothermus granaticius]|uniref:Type-5 uracil-DNA glycosylase n=1 Tax=Meiothermus granaticius NBRC 107808 TaxID=1227551 RepID=A0A399F507_9DEIN|nr:uracil-DNA glycosylase [Meiothermus granaticius]RIH91140.1 uracil-DNA glycosylase, family 4 [Meiothermus granaticius NBRC 107808]GEM86709.1 uracil-DNA glycosylase [Meiothermus granaticius NBRC 107808]
MSLEALHTELTACTRCPRLVAWREQVGLEKRRAYRDQDYWAKPVPGFGDPQALLLIFGLAPGAHGSNRTGRPFTGDASGGFLYPALYRAGLANQPSAQFPGDGLQLYRVYITAAVRCAPPGNKPLPQELKNCSSWTALELGLLPKVRVYLALGQIAHEALLAYHGLRKAHYPFGHAQEYALPGGPSLLSSYHVSRQNTHTGKLTAAMFERVLERAKTLAGIHEEKAQR